METLETQVRDMINRQVARGRVTVRVTLHSAEGNLSARMHLNVPLAKAYANELAQTGEATEAFRANHAGPYSAGTGGVSNG